jgi:hypothetical protein
VELLGGALAWPAGCLIAVGALEADEQPVLPGDRGEVAVGIGVELKAGGLLVERGQRPGSGQSSVIAVSFMFRGISGSVGESGAGSLRLCGFVLTQPHGTREWTPFRIAHHSGRQPMQHAVA